MQMFGDISAFGVLKQYIRRHVKWVDCFRHLCCLSVTTTQLLWSKSLLALDWILWTCSKSRREIPSCYRRFLTISKLVCSKITTCGVCISPGPLCSKQGKQLSNTLKNACKWLTLIFGRLWTYFDTLLKKEIYTLLAKHGPQQPSSPEKLSQDIKHTSFMETLSLEPWVLQHIFRHMTETMFTLNDWRIYRIWWHVFRILKSDECQVMKKPTCLWSVKLKQILTDEYNSNSYQVNWAK